MRRRGRGKEEDGRAIRMKEGDWRPLCRRDLLKTSFAMYVWQ